MNAQDIKIANIFIPNIHSDIRLYPINDLSFDKPINEFCEEYYNEDTFIPNGIWDSAKQNLKYEELINKFQNEIPVICDVLSEFEDLYSIKLIQISKNIADKNLIIQSQLFDPLIKDIDEVTKRSIIEFYNKNKFWQLTISSIFSLDKFVINRVLKQDD